MTQHISTTSRYHPAIPKTACGMEAGYQGYSLAEIREALDRMGIEYNKKARKADLIDLLEVGNG